MKFRESILLALLLLCLYVPTSVAESETSEVRTLNEWISSAVTRNASLKSAFADYKAAMQKSPQVSALPDPKLSYAYFISSVETRTGPQEHKLGVSQSFPWFGTLSLKEEVANSEAKAEFNRFLAIKNEIVFATVKAYSELAFLESSIQITKDIFELVRSWENVLRERFRTSTGTHRDLIRIQVELGKLEDKLSELSDRTRPLNSRLNSLLSNEGDSRIRIEPQFLLKSAKETAVEASFEDVASTNPELAMIAAAAEARKSGISLAEKKFFPDFTLGVDYVAIGERDVAGGGDDAILGMVSINLPINLERNRAALNEAKAREHSIEKLRTDKEFRLREQLSRANYELRDSQRKISLYEKSLIPKTQESIEASYTAYQAGDANFLDVIDSEQRLLEFRLTLAQARKNKIIGMTKLRQLAGAFSELEEGVNR